MNKQQKLSRLLLYVIIFACVIPLLLPFFWLVSSSLKTYNRVYHYPPEWLPIDEKFFIDNKEHFLVNIIDKNEDTGTGVFRVRILSQADGDCVSIPFELIKKEHRIFETVELDGVINEIERLKKNKTNNKVLVLLKNKYPQIEVDPKNIVPETTVKETIHLFRQNLAVDVIEKQNKTSLVRISDNSNPFDISLQKLEEVENNIAKIEVYSKLIPVHIVEINQLASIAKIKIIPSSEILEIKNDRIHETQEMKYFLKENAQRCPIKWIKRGNPGIVKRLDLALTRYVSEDQIKSKEEIKYYSSLYGQRVELKILKDGNNVEVLDPITLDAKLITVETKFAPQWSNYSEVLQKEPFHYYLINTVFIALCSILGQVLSCSLVGYAFARIRFPGRDLLFIVLLSTLMLPHQVIMIPQFIFYVKLGWLDSFKPLIVPTFLAQTAFFVFLFRQYFMTIPLDLEDAARIDGCGPLYTYWHIILPLAKPVIVSVAVFTFMWTWNDFLHPLLYLNSDEHQTLALALENFKTAFGYKDPHFLMAASTMMVLPSIIIFFLAQKAFIRGVVMTGVKG